MPRYIDHILRSADDDRQRDGRGRLFHWYPPLSNLRRHGSRILTMANLFHGMGGVEEIRARAHHEWQEKTPLLHVSQVKTAHRVRTPRSLASPPTPPTRTGFLLRVVSMRGRGVRDYIDGAPVATPRSLNDKPLTAQFGDAADEDWIFVPDSRLRRDRRTCN